MRHLGGIWRHLGGIWEASGGSGLPGDPKEDLEASKLINWYPSQLKYKFRRNTLILLCVFEGDIEFDS